MKSLRFHRATLCVLVALSLSLLHYFTSPAPIPARTSTQRAQQPFTTFLSPLPQLPTWSLNNHQSLRLLCGYCEAQMRGVGGLWNGYPHIKGILAQHGYVTTGEVASATVLIVPSYWRRRVEDWRKWPLNHLQRVNRMWGMHHVSSKGGLARTLEMVYGEAKCPFTPPTYQFQLLRGRRSEADLRALLLARPMWILKTAAHRGQGVRIANSPDLVRALDDRTHSLSHLLNPNRPNDQLLLQAPIERPLLIGGHKSSLRLYALITCADPLRVYLHEDGFVLFASRPQGEQDASGSGQPPDRLAFLTNAAANRGAFSHSDSFTAKAKCAASQFDCNIMASLDLALPPVVSRWNLSSLVRFLSARESMGMKSSSLGAEGLRQRLEKLVLQTWLTAQPLLAKATVEALTAIGLSGTHDYAASFELAAFDVLLDEDLRPWLLEVNTSPSLKVEEQRSNANQRPRPSDDLAIKLRVIEDMLNLADVVPEVETPPENVLASLMRANEIADGTRNSTSIDAPQGACRRTWRLGGCRYCPRWGDIAEVWRTLSERRRAGGFVPLLPATVSSSSASHGTNCGTGSTLTASSTPYICHAPSASEIVNAWLAASPASDAMFGTATWMEARWDAMLCKGTPGVAA